MIGTILIQAISTIYTSIVLFIPLNRLSEITKDYKGVSTFFECLAYLMTYTCELGIFYLVLGVIGFALMEQ